MISNEDLYSSSRAPKLNKQVPVCDCNKGKTNKRSDLLVPFVTKVDKDGFCIYCKHFAVLKEFLNTGNVSARKKVLLTDAQRKEICQLIIKGDTLISIAKKYKTTPSTIWRMSQKLKGK